MNLWKRLNYEADNFYIQFYLDDILNGSESKSLPANNAAWETIITGFSAFQENRKRPYMVTMVYVAY